MEHLGYFVEVSETEVRFQLEKPEPGVRHWDDGIDKKAIEPAKVIPDGETTDEWYPNNSAIVLCIWVLDNDSIGALCGNGKGRYLDRLARTLPRSALPNAK